MTKVYISGPITGTENYMERFEKAEKELTERGYSVINPAKVNAQLPDDTTYEEYMKMSLTMLEMCDCIYMMGGWQNSSGACLECQYAKTLGKEIIFQEIEEKMSEEPQREIWANAVLKDGKYIFGRSGRKCIDLYDFFDDFRSVGLNYEKEIKTGRYNLVTKQVEKAEDCTKFYGQYESYIGCYCSWTDWDKLAEEWKKNSIK